MQVYFFVYPFVVLFPKVRASYHAAALPHGRRESSAIIGFLGRRQSKVAIADQRVRVGEGEGEGEGQVKQEKRV